jgi:MSHA pilin protein MshC
MRHPSGFTILEITVVLLLMGIVSAYVLGRSLTTTDLDLASATDQIRIQLRYAQSMAMKQAHKDVPVWGISATAGTEGEYWLFRGTPATEVRLPGADYRTGSNRVKTTDMKITLNAFTVYFDRIGKPFSPTATEPVNVPLTVTVTAATGSRTITITPETGLVQ